VPEKKDIYKLLPPIPTYTPTHRRQRNSSVVSAASTPSASVVSAPQSEASSSNTTVIDRRIYILRGNVSVPAHFQGLFIVRMHYDWEYADLYLGKTLDKTLCFAQKLTLEITVPSQLDIESEQDDNGSCSLILGRLSQISYVSNPQGGAQEKDHPLCEKKRREEVLVLNFPNVPEAKHFFEYICRSGEHAWELRRWCVTLLILSSSTLLLTHIKQFRSIYEVSYRSTRLRDKFLKNAENIKYAEVTRWIERPMMSPRALNSSSVSVASWALQENHRVLIRLQNPILKNKWITSDVNPSSNMAFLSEPREHRSTGRFLDTVDMAAAHQDSSQSVNSLHYIPVTETRTIYKCAFPDPIGYYRIEVDVYSR